MNKYDIGDQVHLTVVFTNSSGVATSPTTVTCTVQPPSGPTQSLTAVNDSTGNYHADVSPDQSGEWDYRWAGTGALVVAEEGSFYVRERKV
jgi:hypothetical protein